MPEAPKRPCSSPGCRLLASDERYCSACLAAGKGKPVDLRLSASRRGYTSRWRKASKAYLSVHPICKDVYGLHKSRIVPATVTDHIVPHCGDMKLFWDSANWQPLCASCHSAKTATADGGFGNKPAKAKSKLF